MSAYMISVLTCAAVTALVRIMLPNDESTGKYVKYISGLVSLSVIAAPVFDFFRTPTEFPDITFGVDSAETAYGFDFSEKVKSEAERTVAEEIKAGIRCKFGVGADEIDVSVKIDAEIIADMKIEKITVTLTGYGAWSDPDAIRGFISETYDKNAEVEIRYE